MKIWITILRSNKQIGKKQKEHFVNFLIVLLRLILNLEIVDSWEQKKGFMINEKEGIVSIDAYESTTLYIMQKLLELSHAYDREQQKYNEKYLRECGMEFEDELKRNAMKYLFVTSQVMLIYGAAGTQYFILL